LIFFTVMACGGGEMQGQASRGEQLDATWWQRVGKKWFPFLALAFLFLLGGFFLGRVAVADGSAIPGSEEDPLVTAGWVEARLRTLKAELSGLKTEGGNGPRGDAEGQPPSGQVVMVPSPAPVYEVAVLQPGARFLAGHGTEFILRSGRAVTIAADSGGVADLTSGVDLENKEAIPRNHLLLSPKDDGRGAVAETEVIFLIRGKYNVVQ
jgi:hypothetical protein